MVFKKACTPKMLAFLQRAKEKKITYATVFSMPSSWKPHFVFGALVHAGTIRLFLDPWTFAWSYGFFNARTLSKIRAYTDGNPVLTSLAEDVEIELKYANYLKDSQDYLDRGRTPDPQTLLHGQKMGRSLHTRFNII